MTIEQIAILALAWYISLVETNDKDIDGLFQSLAYVIFAIVRTILTFYILTIALKLVF